MLRYSGSNWRALYRALLVSLVTQSYCWAQDISEPFASTAESTSEAIKLPPNARYANAKAVIVGISYLGSEVAETLPGAAKDAVEVARLLKDMYGFSEANLVLCIDSEETKAAAIAAGIPATCICDASLNTIHRVLSNAAKKVSEDDCLLFYFSGHGSQHDDRTGLLWPADVLSLPSKRDVPLPASCLRMDDIVATLHYSLAKHRLLIIDSCHSGMALEGLQERSAATRAAFGDQATLVLCSGAWDERVPDVASDIRPGHSPFTGALLNHLESTNPRTSGRTKYFTSSDLYTGIKKQIMESNHRNSQTKKGREDRPLPFYGERARAKVTAVTGEFCFFPTVELRPSESIIHSLPGLTGAWWFTESPWLIPHVRRRMRDINGEFPPDPLRDRTGYSIDDPRNPQVGAFYDHLKSRVNSYYTSHDAAEKKWFLELARSEDFRSRASTVLSQLEAIADADKSAFDWHLTAVILHYLERSDDAYNAYIRSLQAYGDQTDLQDYRLLCHSDFATFLTAASRYSEALAQCQLARRLQPANSNRAGGIANLNLIILELNAHRKLADWQSARESLEEIARTVDSLDLPITVHPYVAHTLERQAWALMDQLRLDEASEKFTLAIKLRESLPTEELSRQLARLHARHGLAMAIRLAGNAEDSATKLREVVDELEDLTEGQSGDNLLVLLERSINSRERLGDSFFFTPDATESALNRARLEYEAALQRLRISVEERRLKLGETVDNETAVRILCKLSWVCDCLEDSVASEKYLKQSEDALAYSAANNAMIQQSTTLLVEVARYVNGTRPVSIVTDCIATMLKQDGQSKGLNREEREVALTTCNQLLARGNDASIRRMSAQLLRSFPSGDDANRNALIGFLRPYYDYWLSKTMLAMKAESDPLVLQDLHIQLLDGVVRARTGKLFFRADEERAILIVHLLSSDQGIAIVSPSIRQQSEDKRDILVHDLDSQSVERFLKGEPFASLGPQIDAFIRDLAAKKSTLVIGIADSRHRRVNGRLFNDDLRTSDWSQLR